MKLDNRTLVISSNEIGERLNYFTSTFMDTLLGSKNPHNKLTVYYTDGGRIEVTFNKGKELEFVTYNPNGERVDGNPTSNMGFVNEKIGGYMYWNKCQLDRLEMIHW